MELCVADLGARFLVRVSEDPSKPWIHTVLSEPGAVPP